MWSLNGHGLSKVFTGSRALEGKAKVGAGQGWWEAEVGQDDGRPREGQIEGAGMKAP